MSVVLIPLLKLTLWTKVRRRYPGEQTLFSIPWFIIVNSPVGRNTWGSIPSWAVWSSATTRCIGFSSVNQFTFLIVPESDGFLFTDSTGLFGAWNSGGTCLLTSFIDDLKQQEIWRAPWHAKHGLFMHFFVRCLGEAHIRQSLWSLRYCDLCWAVLYFVHAKALCSPAQYIQDIRGGAVDILDFRSECTSIGTCDFLVYSATISSLDNISSKTLNRVSISYDLWIAFFPGPFFVSR